MTPVYACAKHQNVVYYSHKTAFLNTCILRNRMKKYEWSELHDMEKVGHYELVTSIECNTDSLFGS